MNSYTTLQWAAIEKAAKDRLNLASRLRPVLTIAGEKMERYEECAYGGDALACGFGATVLGRLPVSMEQEELRLDWIVQPPNMRPVRMPGFVGRIAALERAGGLTRVEAYTAGYEADREPVGESVAEDISLAGARLDYALYSVLKKLPYAAFELGPFQSPLIYRAGDDRIKWFKKTLDPAQDIANEGEVVLADTPLNALRAYPTSPVAADAAPEWEFAEPVDCDYGGVSDETAGDSDDGERYARVIGVLESTGAKLAERRVDNRGHKVNPRSALVLEFSSEDSITAYERVATKADALSRDDRKIGVAVNYPAFWLARGAVLRAAARDISAELTEGVTLLSEFLFRAGSVQIDVSGMTSAISGIGPILSEVEVPVREKRIATFAGFQRPMIGYAPDGSRYFSSRLGWVSFDPNDGLRFYPERSAPYTVTYDPQEGVLVYD